MVTPSGNKNISDRQIEHSNENDVTKLKKLAKKEEKKRHLPKHKNGNMACIGVYGRFKMELMPMLIDSPIATETIPAAVK